jgi:hypothetical protein
MDSENGLKAPPPPAIVTLAVLVATQLGSGLGLGDGLGLGEGLGLEAWAHVCVTPALRKITLTMTTANWIQSGRLISRGCEERLICAAWS